MSLRRRPPSLWRAVPVAALALVACASPRAPLPTGPFPTPPEARASAAVFAPSRVVVEGGAAWWTLERGDPLAAASGARAADGSAQAVRLVPAGVTEGLYRSGAAILPGAFPRAAPPDPFRTELVFDLDGPDGSQVGITLELRDLSGVASGVSGAVGQLLVTLMDPGADTGAQLSVSTREASPEATYAIVGSAALPRRDWRGTHRLRLDYRPGSLVVWLDGEPLVAADVRLARPAGPLYVGAFASTPTMGATLVDWTFSSPPPSP